MERIGIEVAANFFQRMIGRHELAAVGEIDAVHAGVHVRRTTDQHVHLCRSRFLKVVHSSLAGRPADDGVIYDDHALVPHQFGNEVKLDAHVQIPDEL